MISWASLGVSHVFLENIESLSEDRQDIIQYYRTINIERNILAVQQ